MIRVITEERLNQLIDARLAERLALQEKRQQDNILEKQMRIAMLQAQINPHFLYNALDCIRGQALSKDVPEIAEITQALSGFFRYSVSMHENIVTLKDELNSVRNYVLIQRYRFGDRFQLKIDIDSDDPILYALALPKLTLQPLVENAVLHGFSNVLKKNAMITITAQTTKNHASIHVMDNGVGMDRETYQRICSNLIHQQTENESSGHGIALLNVHRRISLVFGEEYGLNISSTENIGTDIEIYIPRHTPEEMQAIYHE